MQKCVVGRFSCEVLRVLGKAGIKKETRERKQGAGFLMQRHQARSEAACYTVFFSSGRQILTPTLCHLVCQYFTGSVHKL